MIKIFLGLFLIFFVSCSKNSNKIYDNKENSFEDNEAIIKEVKEYFDFNFIVKNEENDGFYLMCLSPSNKDFSYFIAIDQEGYIKRAIKFSKTCHVSNKVDNKIFISVEKERYSNGGFSNNYILVLNEYLQIIEEIQNPLDDTISYLDFHGIEKYNNELYFIYYNLEEEPVNNLNKENLKFYGNSIIKRNSQGDFSLFLDLKEDFPFNENDLDWSTYPFGNPSILSLINSGLTTGVDYHHLNNIDINNNIMYLSGRHTSTIYMYDVETSNLIGTIIGDSDYGLGTYSYIGPRFLQQHSSFIDSEGYLVLFNNNIKKNDNQEKSKIYKMLIDHDNKEVSLENEYSINKANPSIIMGAVTEIYNKDYIITVGGEDVFVPYDSSFTQLIRISNDFSVEKVKLQIRDKNASQRLEPYKIFFLKNN